MPISLKTQNDLEKMRAGGKIASHILNELKKGIKPGITTLEIDTLARYLIKKAGARASFLGYHNYPGAICVSINEELVHGIPGISKIKDGDIVGLDLGIYYQGFHTDTAVTVGIGKILDEAKKLIHITEKALYDGIRLCKAGNYLGDVQNAIQRTVESAGFGIVKDLVGHGVGKELQESPTIPNYGKPDTGIELETGMTLAIEPMVTAGDWHVKVLDDGWTVATVDGSLSAHFEHTIAITENGAEILTK